MRLRIVIMLVAMSVAVATGCSATSHVTANDGASRQDADAGASRSSSRFDTRSSGVSSPTKEDARRGHSASGQTVDAAYGFTVRPADLPSDTRLKAAELNTAPSSGTCTKGWRLPTPESRAAAGYEEQITGPYLYSEAGTYPDASAMYSSIVKLLSGCHVFSERSPDGTETSGQMQAMSRDDTLPANGDAFSIHGSVNDIPISGAIIVLRGRNHVAVVLTLASGPPVPLRDWKSAAVAVGQRLAAHG